MIRLACVERGARTACVEGRKGKGGCSLVIVIADGLGARFYDWVFLCWKEVNWGGWVGVGGGSVKRGWGRSLGLEKTMWKKWHGKEEVE